MVFTPYGAFEGYHCDEDSAYPLTVLIFFWFYIILTAWVRGTNANLKYLKSGVGRMWDKESEQCMFFVCL